MFASLSKYKSGVHWGKQLFVLHIDWAAVLAFVAFWSYGFFGALTSSSIGIYAHITLSLLLCAIFIFFLICCERGDYGKTSLVITLRDISVFLSFLAVIFSLSAGSLTTPIVGDGFSHAQSAELHGTTFVYLLSRITRAFDSVSFSLLLYVINLLVLSAGVVAYLLTKKIGNRAKLILFASAFLFFRAGIIWFGGSASPHPPFRLFPLWFTATIFGVGDFSFRFAQFLGLVAFMWVAQRIAAKYVSFRTSYLFALAGGTIPVLWHTGILVEQSVWTAVLWSVFLLVLVNEGEDAILTTGWVSGLAIFTLLRQSAFVALVPFGIFLIARAVRQKQIDVKGTLFLLSPLLVMAPFLLQSIFGGTSATYIPGEAAYIPAGTGALGRVWIAIQSGVVKNVSLNSVGYLWLIFSLCAFLCLSKKPLKFVALISFFVSALFIFYAIRPGLWGIGRYQAEYIVPFAVAGLYCMLRYAEERFGRYKRIYALILVVLIGYNIVTFRHIAEANKPVDELKLTISDDIKVRGAYHILSELPHDYRSALREVKRRGYAGSLYIAGVTYGVFPQILNGFSVAEVLADKELVATHPTAEDINTDERIKAVLVADLMEYHELVAGLMKSGWRIEKEFKNDEYRSTVFLMERIR